MSGSASDRVTLRPLHRYLQCRTVWVLQHGLTGTCKYKATSGTGVSQDTEAFATMHVITAQHSIAELQGDNHHEANEFSLDLMIPESRHG